MVLLLISVLFGFLVGSASACEMVRVRHNDAFGLSRSQCGQVCVDANNVTAFLASVPTAKVGDCADFHYPSGAVNVSIPELGVLQVDRFDWCQNNYVLLRIATQTCTEICVPRDAVGNVVGGVEGLCEDAAYKVQTVSVNITLTISSAELCPMSAVRAYVIGNPEFGAQNGECSDFCIDAPALAFLRSASVGSCASLGYSMNVNTTLVRVGCAQTELNVTLFTKPPRCPRGSALAIAVGSATNPMFNLDIHDCAEYCTSELLPANHSTQSCAELGYPEFVRASDQPIPPFSIYTEVKFYRFIPSSADGGPVEDLVCSNSYEPKLHYISQPGVCTETCAPPLLLAVFPEGGALGPCSLIGFTNFTGRGFLTPTGYHELPLAHFVQSSPTPAPMRGTSNQTCDDGYRLLGSVLGPNTQYRISNGECAIVCRANNISMPLPPGITPQDCSSSGLVQHDRSYSPNQLPDVQLSLTDQIRVYISSSACRTGFVVVSTLGLPGTDPNSCSQTCIPEDELESVLSTNKLALRKCTNGALSPRATCTADDDDWPLMTNTVQQSSIGRNFTVYRKRPIILVGVLHQPGWVGFNGYQVANSAVKAAVATVYEDMQILTDYDIRVAILNVFDDGVTAARDALYLASGCKCTRSGCVCDGEPALAAFILDTMLPNPYVLGLQYAMSSALFPVETPMISATFTPVVYDKVQFPYLTMLSPLPSTTATFIAEFLVKKKWTEFALVSASDVASAALPNALALVAKDYGLTMTQYRHAYAYPADGDIIKTANITAEKIFREILASPVRVVLLHGTALIGNFDTILSSLFWIHRLELLKKGFIIMCTEFPSTIPVAHDWNDTYADYFVYNALPGWEGLYPPAYDLDGMLFLQMSNPGHLPTYQRFEKRFQDGFTDDNYLRNTILNDAQIHDATLTGLLAMQICLSWQASTPTSGTVSCPVISFLAAVKQLKGYVGASGELTFGPVNDRFPNFTFSYLKQGKIVKSEEFIKSPNNNTYASRFNSTVVWHDGTTNPPRFRLEEGDKLTSHLDGSPMVLAWFIGVVGNWVGVIVLEESSATNKTRAGQQFWLMLAGWTIAICGIWAEAVCAACALRFSHTFSSPHIPVAADGSIFYFPAPMSVIIMTLAFFLLNHATKLYPKSQKGSQPSTNATTGSTNQQSTQSQQRQRQDEERGPPRFVPQAVFALGTLLIAVCIMVVQELARHALRTQANCTSPVGAWLLGIVIAWAFTYPAAWIYFHVSTPTYRSLAAPLLATGMICSIFAAWSQISCYWDPPSSSWDRDYVGVWVGRHGSTLDTGTILIATTAFAAVLGFLLLVANSIRLRFSRSILIQQLKRMEKVVHQTKDELAQAQCLGEEYRLAVNLINTTRPLARPWAVALTLSPDVNQRLPQTKQSRPFENPVGGINRERYRELLNMGVPAQESITLRDVLANPITLELLKDCSAESRESENIMFLLDMHYFAAIPDNDLRAEHIQHIYDMYIAREAPNQINVSVQLRNAISAQIQNRQLTPTIFDQAEQEIYLLVQTNTWPRFLQSPAFPLACQLLASMQSASNTTSAAPDKTRRVASATPLLPPGWQKRYPQVSV